MFPKERVEQNHGRGRPRLERRKTAVTGNDETRDRQQGGRR